LNQMANIRTVMIKKEIGMAMRDLGARIPTAKGPTTDPQELMKSIIAEAFDLSSASESPFEEAFV